MATVKIVLFKSKTYDNGKHPVMLRMTHNRKLKYFSLGVECFENEWDDKSGRFTKAYSGFRERNRLLVSVENRVYVILDDFVRKSKSFTFDAFEKAFLGINKNVEVVAFFEQIIEELKSKNKVGNAGAYKETRNALRRFMDGKKLYFPDIDYTFLKQFEGYLFSHGCAEGGVNFHMRTLRAAINEAIRRGLMDKDLYPFSTQFNRNGYSLNGLKSKSQPRALSEKDLEKIKNFPFDLYPHLSKPVRYFLFSYYARGMNFTDMAKLKWEDIYDGRIHYSRAKTKRKHSIKVSRSLHNILESFYDINPMYIFPILTAFHKTAQQQKDRIKKCLKYYNRDLKDVAKVLNITANLTSYVARHTYATTLKRKGVDVSIISEGLGHAEIGTTMIYLQQFSNEVIDAADEVL